MVADSNIRMTQVISRTLIIFISKDKHQESQDENHNERCVVYISSPKNLFITGESGVSPLALAIQLIHLSRIYTSMTNGN